ncbi:MAG: hypothetical protein JNL36_10690 [Candidatus Kapabacteria bacterium]|nr:hypothetical protein [Candidatus Kapabacteria bacterium]
MKKPSIYFWMISFFICTSIVTSQTTSFDVIIHSRIDTSKPEVKAIANLWIDYLNSTPDSLYDNPYWNIEEKEKFKHCDYFDFSIPHLYQFSSSQLLNYFKPTILTIEKEGEAYGIRTIFFADGLEGKYRKSNPWCIVKLYAIQEKGNWKLKNSLPIITKNWEATTLGKITFRYPSSHKFNKKLAQKSVEFCNSITKEFQFPAWNPFDFYITESGDELGKLLNFDFSFGGYTTGIGLKSFGMLLSGFGSEYYPHEFIHMITPTDNRHRMIDEGFATWKGGQGGKSFQESAKILAEEVYKNDTVTFENVLTKKWGWQHAAFYTTGAIICKKVYDKGGVNAVKKLLETPNSNEKLIENISTILEIDSKEIDSFWRTEVLKYKLK